MRGYSFVELLVVSAILLILAPISLGAGGRAWNPYGLSEDDKISHLVALTQSVSLVVERELKLVGFWEAIPARNKLRAEIQKILLQESFGKLPNMTKKYKTIISRVMEIAEKNNDIILYAE